METVTIAKKEQIPELRSDFIKKVKNIMKEVQADQIKELHDLSPKDKASLLRGLQDVLEGRVRRVL